MVGHAGFAQRAGGGGYKGVEVRPVTVALAQSLSEVEVILPKPNTSSHLVMLVTTAICILGTQMSSLLISFIRLKVLGTVSDSPSRIKAYM